MVSQTENKIYLFLTHQNKEVKVTLEFPEQSNQKAEQEFIHRLTAVCLKKIETKAMEKEDLSLQFPAIKDMEGKSID